MSDTVTQAIQMIESQDLTRWSDAHDKVVLRLLKAALAAPHSNYDELVLDSTLSTLQRFGLSAADLMAYRNRLYEAPPEPQPVKQADQSCRNCTFHYEDVDMPPCNSCTLGDHVGSNWEPMSEGQRLLNRLRKLGAKPWIPKN